MKRRADGMVVPWGPGALALALVALAPGAARAEARLLDQELVLSLAGPPAGGPDLSAEPQAPPPSPGSLDFDLLGAPAPAPSVDPARLRLRRTMLTVHQGVGFGLVALQLATTVLGQLNYSDRFGGGPSTGKWEQPHAALAYATLSVFALDGLLALLAPAPLERSEGLDRVTVHKMAMFTAAGGMAAEAVLGVVTAGREGYLNQPGLATAHLVLGYVTLAAVLAGVSALVF